MRSSMLLAALAAFSASVSAVPAKKDDCTCVNVVTSTTVVFDRTKVVKSKRNPAFYVELVLMQNQLT
jgi:hypothetical protein